MRITNGITIRERHALGGGIEFVELICGTEVSCDSYVACDADTVWIVDDAENYLVDDAGNYIIE